MTIGCFITIAVLVFIDSIVEQLPKTIKGIVKRVAKLMIIGEAIAVPLACLFGALAAIKLTKTVNQKENKQEMKSNKAQKPLDIEEIVESN